MDSLMDMKIGALTEAQPTLLTFIGFLSRVDSEMNVKIRATTEALSTGITLIWFLTTMTPLMVQKI